MWKKTGIPNYPKYWVTTTGLIYGPKGKPLKPDPTYLKNTGYESVTLYNSKGPKKFKVHVLVAEAFLGTREDTTECIRHLNGIRNDNRKENLAWGTHKENALDRKAHGTHLSGEKHPMSELTWEQVNRIMFLHESGVTSVELTKIYDVHRSTIERVVSGRTWIKEEEDESWFS